MGGRSVAYDIGPFYALDTRGVLFSTRKRAVPSVQTGSFPISFSSQDARAEAAV